MGNKIPKNLLKSAYRKKLWKNIEAIVRKVEKVLPISSMYVIGSFTSHNIEYVTSLATVHADGSPSLVISCMADYVAGEVKLNPEESDRYTWVSLEEAKVYQLIDGIYDELVTAENLRNGKKTEWQRF